MTYNSYQNTSAFRNEFTPFKKLNRYPLFNLKSTMQHVDSSYRATCCNRTQSLAEKRLKHILNASGNSARKFAFG